LGETSSNIIETDMRIGFDVSDLSTGRADGTTRYTYELAKRFPGMDQSINWMYFTPGEYRENFQFSSHNFQTVISKWPKWWTQSRLPIDLYRYRPDVFFMPIQQLPILRPGKMKTAAVIHDLAVHMYPEQYRYKDWLLLRAFSAQAAREADEIIAVSQATADDIAKYYGRTENVRVVHHGVDHEMFCESSGEEKEKSLVKLKQKYPNLPKKFILFVGQIQPRKNITGLIEAFEMIDDAELELVIAGSHGWLKQAIFDRVNQSIKRDKIHRLGRVPDDLLPALYRNAEVFVLPSFYEGFGMPLVEAMASGCPVVTSNVSSMPEVTGDAAVLIDPNSSEDMARGIERAIIEREKLILKGLVRSQEFSWDKCAQETLEVLIG